jgi:predicted MFS family arabinose efflux permease
MRRAFPHAAPDGALATVMLAFLATAGLFYVNILAALVDGLMHGLGFSSEQAGMVGATNVYGAAMGVLAAAFIAHRLAWRPVCLALLLTLILLDGISMLAHSPLILTGLRAADGLAGGFLVGTAYSVISRTKDPDRVFGMVLIVQFGLGGACLAVLPGLVARLGAPVLFGALIAFSVATLAMLPFLAPYQPARVPVAEQRSWERPPLPVLLGIFLFQAGNMGLAAYIIGLGEAKGIGRDTIGPVLGIANWVGLLGSGFVVLISRRFGRFRPLLAGLGATILGLAAFAWPDHGAVYAAANGITAITWNLVIPYLFGLCTGYGGSGRSAILASFFSKIGLASGPLIAGFLVRGDDYRPLVWVSVAALVIASAAVLPAARAADLKSAAQP